ncbi:MAG: PspC domain-containing protein [Bacteroidetes bacterium]|nr:MAG: PspC domain-containing protein [Bacteroidota bacterium]
MDRKFYRSKQDKVIGGVAGGIADYFDIDPVIVRIVFVLAALGWGVSILAYIVLWIIIPESPEPYKMKTPEEMEVEADYFAKVHADRDKKRTNMKIIFAVFLIVIGLTWFLGNIFEFVSFHHVWPLVMIALGILILIKAPLFGNHRRVNHHEI